MPTERRRVFYAGRVQGVGFRYTAERLARRFAVKGFVRNLPDGRVELVAEGEAETVAAFLRAVRGEMGDKVQSATEAVEPAGDPGYPDFSIQY